MCSTLSPPEKDCEAQLKIYLNVQVYKLTLMTSIVQSKYTSLKFVLNKTLLYLCLGLKCDCIAFLVLGWASLGYGHAAYNINKQPGK